ncbi:MAG: HD-GYP domain-containing protein [Chloroflexi bacterium]|nr:HD-GYP domain-containing protein [Chloroflexota bacterium]
MASLTMRRARPRPLYSKLLVWGFHVALPPLLFWLLLEDPLLDPMQRAPYTHFWVVSLAAIGGLAIAGVVAGAALRHQDSRVFLIALAFFSIAGIFLMHSLSTESIVLNAGEAGFIWSPPLCLMLGAIFFLLSSFRFGDNVNAWILLNQRRLLVGLLAALVGYAALVVLFPEVMNAILGDNGSSDAYSVTAEGGVTNMALVAMLVVAVCFYAISALRYYLAYRRQQSVLLLSILTGMVLFAEADAFMAFSDAWHISWWLYHVVMVAAFLIVGYGLMVQYGKRRSVYGLFEEVFLREQIARINANYTEVMIGLINSLEAKDKYTKGHSARVAQYAVLIARNMGYDEEGVHRIEQAALLHDIGKLAIPDAILNKPGKLTPEEFEYIKNHPSRGCAIIHHIESLQDKIPGILHHHEWFDGSGYPDGLAGDHIPLDARIIAVADVYDAMTSLRAYRQPLSREGAVEHLQREAGRHLDPECVEVFIQASSREQIDITDFTAQLPVDQLGPPRAAVGSG